jgi:sporulation protein YlmC with PRC-barrel domain
MSQNRNTRLQELGGSDYEIADGQPDIKGWDVKDESGQLIGEVDELLFDPETRKVRYLVVDLEGNAFDLDARDVLIPIGIAALHENDDDVILMGVTPEQLSSLPNYDESGLSMDHEQNIRRSFSQTETTATAPAAAMASETTDDFYNHEHFDERRLYRNRKLLSDTTSADTNSTNTEYPSCSVRLRGTNDSSERNDVRDEQRNRISNSTDNMSDQENMDTSRH